jgi:hypothetical protein
MLMTNNFRISDLGTEDAQLTFDDLYRLKISSKKLNSGKCQVKFYATVEERKDLYGYVLVDGDQTLKDVINKIKSKLTTISMTRDFHHIHLYSIGKSAQDDLGFIIFDK